MTPETASGGFCIENEIAGIVLTLAGDAGRWILPRNHGLHTFVSVCLNFVRQIVWDTTVFFVFFLPITVYASHRMHI